ncbi:pyridoxal 5'-phosphate synthase (glutamine hydrolyzing) [Trifolium repens]|nr:pyridoxal 5'-phosphate synthase (glutamine hydrolyzing) [Trifolium repens]
MNCWHAVLVVLVLYTNIDRNMGVFILTRLILGLGSSRAELSLVSLFLCFMFPSSHHSLQSLCSATCLFSYRGRRVEEDRNTRDQILDLRHNTLSSSHFILLSYIIGGATGILMTSENTEEQSKVIVAVRQGNILATAFHPELTADTRWHSYFLKMGNVIGEEASSSIVPAQVSTSSKLQSQNDLPIFQ